MTGGGVRVEWRWGGKIFCGVQWSTYAGESATGASQFSHNNVELVINMLYDAL